MDPTLRAQHEHVFGHGARVVLQRWTVLQLAVENFWGGETSPQKAQDMGERLIQTFASEDEVYADEVEDFLDDFLIHEMNAEAEDGSPAEVSRLLVDMHRECLAGDYTRVEQLVQAPVPVGGASQSMADPNQDEDTAERPSDQPQRGEEIEKTEKTKETEETEMVDVEKEEKEEEEQGWHTVYKGKGKKT